MCARKGPGISKKRNRAASVARRVAPLSGTEEARALIPTESPSPSLYRRILQRQRAPFSNWLKRLHSKITDSPLSSEAVGANAALKTVPES